MEIMELKLTQAPIIQYNAIDSIAREVATKVKGMDLENIEINEDNYKDIKKMRTNLSKEFKVYEEKRKLIKDMVMKPYDDFESEYKKISIVYKRADEVLKSKVNSAEEIMLKQKVDGLKEYFNEINKFDWFTFDDLGIKINRSDSDKSKKEEISSIVEQTKVNVAAIQSMENSDRILAKYQINKDMNVAIAQVMQEINIENNNKAPKKHAEAQNVVTECKDTLSVETKHEELKNEEKQDEKILVIQPPKLRGTKEQFKLLKNFIERIGMTYEQ